MVRNQPVSTAHRNESLGLQMTMLFHLNDEQFNFNQILTFDDVVFSLSLSLQFNHLRKFVELTHVQTKRNEMEDLAKMQSFAASY